MASFKPTQLPGERKQTIVISTYTYIKLTYFDYTDLPILPYYEKRDNSNKYLWIIISMNKSS